MTTDFAEFLFKLKLNKHWSSGKAVNSNYKTFLLDLMCFLSHFYCIFCIFLLLFTALQDLQSNIRQLMHERDEVQIKANDKDRQLAELRKEVNNVIDKKKRLEHETERLKQHLVSFETNKILVS